MSMCCCQNKVSCAYASVIVSIVIGIIAAFLQITGVISIGDTILWVVLGVALVFLAVILVALALNDNGNSCGSLCTILSIVLIGILGTILFSLVLLGIEFAATSVIGAIIVGLLAGSFALIVTGVACLARCFANCKCCKE